MWCSITQITAGSVDIWGFRHAGCGSSVAYSMLMISPKRARAIAL